MKHTTTFDQDILSLGNTIKNKHGTFVNHVESFLLLIFLLIGIIMRYLVQETSNTILLPFVLFIIMYLVGVRVMHTYIHGAGLKNQKLSYNVGSSSLLLLIGWKALNWFIQHNHLHHSNPNIHNHDEDIDGHGVLRIHKEESWKRIHRFQRYGILAWPIYSIMTLYWIGPKDFKQLYKYASNKKIQRIKPFNYYKQLCYLIISKLVFLCIWILGPIYVGNIDSIIVIGGFIGMHLLLGLSLGLTFQIAHRGEKTGTLMPITENNPRGKRSFCELQLETTANFSTGSRFITWFTGGLNYQIEHHLFPNIHPRHYPELSKKIQEIAKKHEVEYHVYSSVFEAVSSHMKELHILSYKD